MGPGTRRAVTADHAFEVLAGWQSSQQVGSVKARFTFVEVTSVVPGSPSRLGSLFAVRVTGPQGV